jgi:hypothetical protein
MLLVKLFWMHLRILMCDCLVALPQRSRSGRTLFAKNSDRPAQEKQIIRFNPARHDTFDVKATYISVAPHAGRTLSCVLSLPEWCWGAEHGVNEAGVAIGNETIYTTDDPRQAPDALIGMDLVRLALERATTALEASDVIAALIDEYGQGGSGHDTCNGAPRRPYWSSFLIADPADAWVVETSGTTVSRLQVSSTWAISNRTTIPEFDAAFRHPKQPVHLLVDPRLNASRVVLDQPSLGVEVLQKHLSSHVGGDDGWTVCMHARHDDVVVELTTASMIAELDTNDSTVHWAQGSPCITPYESSPFSKLAGRLTPVDS